MKMDRSTRFNLRLQSFVTGMLVAVILALLALASHRYPVRWDWTAAQRNTLAEQSLKAIDHFADGLEASVYVQEKGEQRLQAEELLTKYQAANPDFRVRYVDPDVDPAAARADEVTTYGTVVLRAGERKEKVTGLTEEALTNGLVRLGKGSTKTVRFITGHGEHPLEENDRNAYRTVLQLLKGEGYQVEALNLATVEAVPENTALLVLAGPRKALLPVEVERLGKWLDPAGRLLIMVDPGTASGLEEWLQKQGLTFQEGLVLDPVARLFGGGPTTPLVDQYSPDHPITRKMEVASFFPEARGLKLEANGAGTIQRSHLLAGAERGWLESGSIASGKAEFNEGQDTKGPILLGAALESGQQRIVAVGDSDFAADAYISFAGNSDLFLNIVRWLAEDENFIAIKPKAVVDSGIALPRGAGMVLLVGLVGVVPLTLAGTGFFIWLRRKRR